MSKKPPKPKDKHFKTTGTIRVQIECTDGVSARTAKIFLTPIDEYAASPAGEHYALLLPVDKNGGEVKSTTYKPGEGIPICVHGDFGDLTGAAARQTAVEVEVVDDRKKGKDGAWKLRGITIPAPVKKR